ncbi:hypothetical protein MKW98_025304, partial [Papaver atlanticum]
LMGKMLNGFSQPSEFEPNIFNYWHFFKAIPSDGRINLTQFQIYCCRNNKSFLLCCKPASISGSTALAVMKKVFVDSGRHLVNLPYFV